MNVVFFDDNPINLLPFTFTRPVCEMRVGILTIRKKWEKRMKTSASHLTEAYLSKKFSPTLKNENIVINGSVCPTDDLMRDVVKLKKGQKLVNDKTLIAFNASGDDLKKVVNSGAHEKINIISELVSRYPVVESKSEKFIKINHPWDIFSQNGKALEEDYAALTKGRKSAVISKTNEILGKEIFVAPGAHIECSTLNSTTGPVYIGKNAEVMEGSAVRGPFALCDHSTLKLSSKIYGPSTVGPYSKVGGEVSNCVIFGYSNKAHDGFIGNSVIGYWCNLGADTNTSNLKNTYAEVEVWNYGQNRYMNSGLVFCGLFMGDHSKCGINTMFNTGTMVGVGCNIFGSGFPRTFIPDFSWGGPQGYQTYLPKKLFEVEKEVYKRRNKIFDDSDKEILTHVFEETKKYRENY